MTFLKTSSEKNSRKNSSPRSKNYNYLGYYLPKAEIDRIRARLRQYSGGVKQQHNAFLETNRPEAKLKTSKKKLVFFTSFWSFWPLKSLLEADSGVFFLMKLLPVPMLSSFSWILMRFATPTCELVPRCCWVFEWSSVAEQTAAETVEMKLFGVVFTDPPRSILESRWGQRR